MYYLSKLLIKNKEDNSWEDCAIAKKGCPYSKRNFNFNILYFMNSNTPPPKYWKLMFHINTCTNKTRFPCTYVKIIKLFDCFVCYFGIWIWVFLLRTCWECWLIHIYLLENEDKLWSTYVIFFYLVYLCWITFTLNL